MDNDTKGRLSDALLEAALEEQLETDPETLSYPSTEEPTHIFSEEHNQKMKRIYKMAKKAERRPQRLRHYRQLTAGFLIFFVVSGITVSQVEAFRLPILNFFTEVRQSFTLFDVQKQPEHSLTKDFKEYEPSYSPDGFAVAEVSESPDGFYIFYKKEQTNQIYHFYYKNITARAALDTENSKVTDTVINDNRTVIIEKEEHIRVIMYKNNSHFQVDGNITVDEAKKVMESIK